MGSHGRQTVGNRTTIDDFPTLLASMATRIPLRQRKYVPTMSAVIVIAIFIVIAILNAMLCTRYRERWCAREGFEDLGKVATEWYERLKALQGHFGAGEVGHTGSALRKVIDGHTLWLLEIEWRTRSFNSQRAHWKTFVIWELDEPGLPQFTLRRRSPFVEHAVTNVIRAIVFLPHLLFLRPLGAPSLQTFAHAENNEANQFSDEFARQYEVIADAEAARKLFTRDRQACFCEQPLTGDLTAIDRMLIWQAPGLLAPWNLDEKRTVAIQLRQLFLP